MPFLCTSTTVLVIVTVCAATVTHQYKYYGGFKLFNKLPLTNFTAESFSHLHIAMCIPNTVLQHVIPAL